MPTEAWRALPEWIDRRDEPAISFEREIYIDCDGPRHPWVTELQTILEPRAQPSARSLRLRDRPDFDGSTLGSKYARSEGDPVATLTSSAITSLDGYVASRPGSIE